MARRRVTVELFLEAAQANNAARRFAVTVRGSEAAVEELGDASDRTGRDLKQLAANSDVAARAVDDVGDQARGAAVGLALMDREIDKVRRSTLSLAALRAALGPGSGFWGRLVPGNWTPGGGRGFDFSNFASESRGVLITSLIAGIAAVAPELSGAIGTAVTGAVGLGGVVGGVAAAAKDPTVRSEFQNLIARLMGDLDPLTDTFAGPVINAMRLIDDVMEGPFGLQNVLKDAAKWVVPITRGLVDMVDALGPGLSTVFNDSGPMMEQIGQSLPKISIAISDMLGDFAEHGDAMAEGFDDTVDTLAMLLRILTGLLIGLSETWQLVKGAAESATVSMESGLRRIPGGVSWIIPQVGIAKRAGGWLGDNLYSDQVRYISLTELARQRTDALRHSTERYVMSVRELDAAYRDLFDVMMSLDQANLSVQQGWLDLRETLKENGRHWETNTQAGLDNRAAILDQVEALEAQREKMIESGTSTQDANAWYNAQLLALEKLAKQYGITQQALDDLIRSYLIAAGYAMIVGPNAAKMAKEQREVRGYAHGGRPQPGVPYLVGEYGPEWRVDDPGTVYPHGVAPWQGPPGGGSSGASAPIVIHLAQTIITPDGDVVRRQLIDATNRRNVPAASIRVAYP